MLEIIDSFNNSLFDGDYREGVRVLGIIKEMTASEKYEKYFNKLDIVDLFRESYNNWVKGCNEEEYLLSQEEIKPAIKLFLPSCTSKIVSELGS